MLSLASGEQAAAHDRVNFREFREQNPGVERHTARTMFRELRGTARNGSAEIIKTPDLTSAINAATQRVLTVPIQSNSNIDLSQKLRGQTRQSDLLGNIVRLKAGLDIDLTSATRNISLGKNLFGGLQSVTINTDSGAKTVSAGSLVSAAEYIAVKQILAGGGQQLTIDKNGRATSGSVDLDAITGTNDIMRAATYVNARGVTTTGDFSKRSEFKLLGDLNNFGTVVAEAGSLNARAGAIRADDINNFSGATITSNIDLTLDASGAFTNRGTIHSSGALTITADGSVSNSGSISASSDLQINSSTVRNGGQFSSVNGNVNFNAPQDLALTINNKGGAISALNGAINLRDSHFAGTSNTLLTGHGDLFSKELNINAGQGTAWVEANELTGSINQTGSAAHVIASTDLMTIGNVCLTGDPTYFNTAGSILINDDVIVSEKLVIAAAGNIASQGTLNIVAGNNSQGFDITMIAGADFKNTGGGNRSVLPGDGTGTGAIRLTGKSSKTGGSIVLFPNTQVSSRALNSSGAKNGGDVQLFAFSGKGIDGIPAGIVDFQHASISTGGNGAGTNGDLLIVAGAKSAALGIGVITGQISTSGGSGAGGDITIVTAEPTVSVPGATVTYDQNGNRTSAAELVASGKLVKKGSIAILGTVTGPTSVNLTAGKNIIVNNVISGSKTATLSAGGDIVEKQNGNSVQALEMVTLNAGGNIGSDLIPFTVNGPRLEFTAKGFALINSTNSGAWLVGGSVPKGNIVITAPNATLSATSLIAKNIGVQASAFGTFDKVSGSSVVSLTSNGATNFGNSAFGELSAPNLILQTNGSIGTAGTAFVLPTNTKLVYALAASGGNVNLAGSTNKTVEFNNISGGNVKVSNIGSTLLSGNTAASGTFTAEALSGTLSIDGDVSTNGAQTYTSAGTNGKLTIKSNTALLGASTININVGSPTATPMPPVPNINTIGAVLLTGNEIKAKKPESTISGAPGRQIKINNGNSKGAISFGGDILISTDN